MNTTSQRLPETTDQRVLYSPDALSDWLDVPRATVAGGLNRRNTRRFRKIVQAVGGEALSAAQRFIDELGGHSVQRWRLGSPGESSERPATALQATSERIERQARLAHALQAVRPGQRVPWEQLAGPLDCTPADVRTAVGSDEGQALFRIVNQSVQQVLPHEVARNASSAEAVQTKLERTLSAAIWRSLKIRINVPLDIWDRSRSLTSTLFVDKVEWRGKHHFVVSTAGPVAEVAELPGLTTWPVEKLDQWQPEPPRRFLGRQPPLCFTYGTRDVSAAAEVITSLCRTWSDSPDEIRVDFTLADVPPCLSHHARLIQGYWRAGVVRRPVLGHCNECRNPLTTEASLMRGYGPTCWRRLMGIEETATPSDAAMWRGSSPTPTWSALRGPTLAALCRTERSTN